MKRFEFSLDKVLSYKQQIEDNLRTEHAGAVRAVIQKEEELRQMEDEHQMFVENMETIKKQGCTIQELRFYEGYLDSSRHKIEKQKKTLENLHKREEKKRDQVIEAKKERTSIDMLKEKKRSEYDFMVQKEEERFIEEFVSNSRFHAG